MRRKKQKGQALLLVTMGLSLFLIGALGLAIDGSNLYAHRQMAQIAADAAAQAGIMSIFNGTNIGGNAFGTPPTPAAFDCATSDVRTPCVYALKNGFGSTGDTVAVSFPTSAPGVTLSPTDPVPLIQVTVSRTVKTTLIRFLGPATTTVKATAVAAIIDVVSPVPIIVTHPTMPGALSSNGNPTITICGGPRKSIQVNSDNATAFTNNSNTTIDLSKAGPNDPGNCTTGTGADFGSFGGPSEPTFDFLGGSAGKFIQPASWIEDPLRFVPQPAVPANLGTRGALSFGSHGCPPEVPGMKPCTLYTPGHYPGRIDVKNETAIFSPGLYYTEGGFGNAANGEMYMSTGFADDPVTGQGMVVFNTGGGGFNVGANSAANLVGAPMESIYKGILLFQDRNAPATTHRLGGGGSMTLIGTVYVTNTRDGMLANPGQYQTLLLQGTPGSATRVIGEIITSALQLGGNAGIIMQLDPGAKLHVRQVALVK